MDTLKIISYLLTEQDKATFLHERKDTTDFHRGYWKGQIDCIDDFIAWLEGEGK